MTARPPAHSTVLTLPPQCLWTPDGRNDKELEFPSYTYSPSTLTRSINSVPSSYPKYTPLLPLQHTAILGMRKGRRREREEKGGRSERGVQGSLPWSVRSGGPDLNPPPPTKKIK